MGIRWHVVGWFVSSLVLVAIIVVLARSLALGTGSDLPRLVSSGALPAAPALPEQPLRDVDADHPIDLSETPLPGPVIVNFWASWCGPCRDEMPDLVAVADAWADDGVQVVGINAQDLRRDALDFADEYEVNYPLVVATRADEAAWGTRGFPETFFIDRDGRVAAHIPGPVDRATIEHVLEELNE